MDYVTAEHINRMQNLVYEQWVPYLIGGANQTVTEQAVNEYVQRTWVEAYLIHGGDVPALYDRLAREVWGMVDMVSTNPGAPEKPLSWWTWYVQYEEQEAKHTDARIRRLLKGQ